MIALLNLDDNVVDVGNQMQMHCRVLRCSVFELVAIAALCCICNGFVQGNFFLFFAIEHD